MKALTAETSDWSRERPRKFWDPGRKLLKTIRDYQRLEGAPGPLAAARRRMIRLRHRFWSTVTQCDISLSCRIGGGLLLPHPNGIVIHPQALIGETCLIMQQVTLGQTHEVGAPVLGKNVFVGAGAKLFGAITVGDYARIGANAVVLEDVPANATAVGVPARVIRRRDIDPATGDEAERAHD
ncbi:MAG: serine O-acetyltransferase [Parvularculaceae bacterium]